MAPADRDAPNTIGRDDGPNAREDLALAVRRQRRVNVEADHHDPPAIGRRPSEDVALLDDPLTHHLEPSAKLRLIIVAAPEGSADNAAWQLL